MEKDIKLSEWELQQLLEQKNFKELSASEKSKLKGLVSEDEYSFRRQIIVATEKEDETLVPLPLVLPTKKGGLVIPLYQALLAVAATVLVMLLLKFPYSNLEQTNESDQIKYVSVTDTIKEIEYIYDTIYKEIEKTKVVEKKVYVPQTKIEYVKVYSEAGIESREVLNAPNNYQTPDLKALINEVDGSESLANDPTSNLFRVKMYRD